MIWVYLLRRGLSVVPCGRFPIFLAIFCRGRAGPGGGLWCWIVGLGCKLVRGLVELDACKCGQARWRWLIGVVRGIAWLDDHYVSEIFRDWSINWSNWSCRFEGLNVSLAHLQNFPGARVALAPIWTSVSALYFQGLSIFLEVLKVPRSFGI